MSPYERLSYKKIQRARNLKKFFDENDIHWKHKWVSKSMADASFFSILSPTEREGWWIFSRRKKVGELYMNEKCDYGTMEVIDEDHEEYLNGLMLKLDEMFPLSHGSKVDIG